MPSTDIGYAATRLPQHVVEYFGQLLIARGADQAFRTKMELVNFKKVPRSLAFAIAAVAFRVPVAQHFQKQLEEIESNLSVFAAIAYCDPSNPEAADKEARKHAAKLAKEVQHPLSSRLRDAAKSKKRTHALRSVCARHVFVCSECARSGPDEASGVCGSSWMSAAGACMR
eukprot:3006656-Rhodomonas_salina.2